MSRGPRRYHSPTGEPSASELAARAYLAGRLTLAEAGARFGVTAGSVCYGLRKLDPDRTRMHSGSPPDHLAHGLVVELVAAGKSDAEVAEATGYCLGNVQRVRRKVTGVYRGGLGGQPTTVEAADLVQHRGFSVADAAHEVGCSASAVYDELRRRRRATTDAFGSKRSSG